MADGATPVPVAEEDVAPATTMIAPESPPVATQTAAPQTAYVQPTSTPDYGSIAAQVLQQIAQQNPQAPAGATTPLNMTTAPPYLGTPTPPHVVEHLSTLNRVLGDVSSFLAGPSTYTLTKAPDGTMSVAETPATQKEKWGQIAAAALGGAAQGLAHSTGPNALPAAAAAGFATGQQIPVNQEQQRQQAADFQNKQLLAQANRIHLTQETYMLGQEAKLNDLKLNAATMDTLNQYADALKQGGAVDLGTVDPSDPNSAMNLAKQNPGAMDAFLGKGDKEMRFVMEPDHQMHMMMTDKAWEQQRNSEPMQAFYIGKGANDEPTLMSEMVPVNADTRENINTHNAAVQKQFYQFKSQFASAQKSQAEANAEPDKLTETQKRDAATAAYQRDRIGIERGQLQVAQSKVDQANATAGAGVGNWGQLLSDPHSGVTLAQVPSRQRSAVLQSMQQNNQKIARPLTADEIKRSDLATNAISNIEEAQSILQRRPDLFGVTGFGKSKFSEAIGQGDPDALRYQTAISLANLPAVGIHGIRGKWAFDDLSKLDSTLYRSPQAMAGILDEIHRSATEFAGAGGRPTTTPAAPATTTTTPAAGRSLADRLKDATGG